MSGFVKFVNFDPDTGDIRSIMYSNVLVALSGYSLAIVDPAAGAFSDLTHRVDLTSLSEDADGNLVVGNFITI